MPVFASEAHLLSVLSMHDDLVLRCVRGEIDFRAFEQQYDHFLWRCRLEEMTLDSAERSLFERHGDRLRLHKGISEEVFPAPEGQDRGAAYGPARGATVSSAGALQRLRAIVAASHLQQSSQASKIRTPALMSVAGDLQSWTDL